MNHLSILSPRLCLWCEQPFEGRADKVFCRSACKASYNRVTPPALHPTATPRPSVTSTSRLAGGMDVSPNDRPIPGQQDESTMMTQSKRVALDHQYRYSIGWLLRYESGYGTLANVNKFILEVEQRTQAYLQHPDLLAGSQLAHRRLADLYLVLDYVRNLRQERLQEAGEQDQAEYQVQLWSIELKHKDTMWNNLLADASAVDSGVG